MNFPKSWELRRARFSFKLKDIRGAKAPLASATKNGVSLRSELDFSVWNPTSHVDNYKLVEPDDFVIGLRSFQHGISHSTVRGLVSPAYTVLYPVEGLVPGFYKHYFRSSFLVSQLANITQGIRQGQTVDTEAFLNLSIPVPPQVEQRRIADFLDAETTRIDELSAVQIRLGSTLKERESVDIELALFLHSSSEARLKYLLRSPLSYGANESAAHTNPEWPRYIRTTDIADNGSLRDETFASLPPSAAKKYMLEDGDILLVRSGATVGKSLLYESRFGPAAHAGYLIRGRIDRQKIIPRLLWYFCQTGLYWQQIGEDASRATIQNVNAEKYGNLVIPVCSIEKQGQIVAYLDDHMARSRDLQRRALRQCALLGERRQALITAAVTGQFDVSTASGRGVME